MSRLMSRVRSRGAAKVAAAVVTVAGGLVPAVGHAAMVVNLSLAPLGSTAPKSLLYLTPDNTNADVPIYVYATVTGANTVTSGTGSSATAPITTGDFDGLQYLYYNVLNSGATPLAGGIDTGANGPKLNATLGFNSITSNTSGGAAGSSQPGTVQNIPGSVSVGTNPSAVLMTDYAKPRANGAVFDNFSTFNQSTGTYTYANDGTNIIVNGNTVSFLVETLAFKQTSFTSANKSGGKLSTTFSVQVPTFTNLSYDAANYFLDSPTSAPPSPGSLAAVTKTAYSAGTSVTLTDTILGDLDRNGVVNGLDFNILLNNFNKTVTTYAAGDIDGNGVVNGLDFNALLNNFNFTVGVSPSIQVAPLEAFAVAHDDVVGFDAALLANPSYQAALAAAVPEPASLSILAIGGAAMLVRRRRAQ